jgi:hypothetical protein
MINILLPAGRAFSRRLYMATTKASKPHHFIRITTGMRNDLLMRKMFLVKINGVSYNLQVKWMSNVDLELDTDTSLFPIGKPFLSLLVGFELFSREFLSTYLPYQF